MSTADGHDVINAGTLVEALELSREPCTFTRDERRDHPEGFFGEPTLEASLSAKTKPRDEG